jgi:Heterokaryon incompatibility protein (HET)
LISVPKQAIAAAIDAKQIPLLEISHSDSVSIKLVSTDLQTRRSYTAISHVWADGLGNPTVGGESVHGLAACQIARLHKYCKNLASEGPVLLWMDTFCVPAGEEFKAQRKTAISTMREVYANAARVLVLDGELLQHCMHENNLEILLRLFSSGWMQRVWTLQEGTLNNNTYVQFRDGIVDPRQISSWIKHARDFAPRGERLFMVDEVAFGWEKMTTGIHSPKPHNLISIYEYFQSRRTSHAGDEAICLAILAGLETSLIKMIVSTGETEAEIADLRMKRFLSLHDQIPLFLLFTGNAHFEDEGFRWAPRSFIRHETGQLSSPGEFSATATFLQGDNNRRCGLYFSSHGFLLKIAANESPKKLFHISVSNLWYTCALGDDQTVAAKDGLLVLRKPAMVYGTLGAGGIGALIDITDDVDGRYFAKYISQAVILPTNEIFDSKRRLQAIGASNGIAKEEIMMCEETDLLRTQLWCIY